MLKRKEKIQDLFKELDMKNGVCILSGCILQTLENSSKWPTRCITVMMVNAGTLNFCP